MRRIRLGVIFDAQIRAGGGYQQSLNAALLTRMLPKELIEVIFFHTSSSLCTHCTHTSHLKHKSCSSHAFCVDSNADIGASYES